MKKNQLLFSFLAVLLTTAISLGQEPIRVEVKNVHLPLLVFENGQTVQLSRENFRVFEGEKNGNSKVSWTEQEIQNFSRYEEQGIALAVANDTSGSMAPVFKNGLTLQKDKIEEARNASRALFKAVFREGKDRGLVSEIFYEPSYISLEDLEKELGFVPKHSNPNFFYKNCYWHYITTKTIKGKKYALVSVSLFVDQDWTPDLKEVEIGISYINQGNGATPLRDGLFNLAKHFSQADKDLLRVAVVLTDGLDSEDPQKKGDITFNSHNLKEVVAELQNSQILIYAVGLYNRSVFDGSRPENDFLEELAKSTGGLAFFETDLSKLTGLFQRIGSMIRSVNYLSYEPKSIKEGERLIKVEAGEWDENHKWHQKKYNLFYRKGYTYKK